MIVDKTEWTVEELKEELNDLMNRWREFRRPLRQILYDHGLPSNPGWSDRDIVEGIYSILKGYRGESLAPKAKGRA